MSEKVCSHHENKGKKRLQRLCGGFLVLCLIFLFIFFITWAVLQPRKPKFTLQDATVFAFNVSNSPPNFLTSTFQITITSHNPNRRVGIYYDRLNAYASYQNQQITYYTSVPPTYQGHKDTDVWSPLIAGVNVPVAPFNGIALSSDHADGTVMLTIKIDGRVRWKVGTFISGHYHLHVRCPALITFGSRSTGVVVGSAIKYQLVQKCSVSV